MNGLTHLVAFLIIATVSSSSIVKSPSEDGTFELLILHNNDMHARFEQTSQLSGACTAADRNANKCYGGFPRVAHVVKEARRAASSGEGPPVLYLNAGDTYTGTAWFTIYKWKIAAEFINALQPDAVSLGNNEIERGSSKLTPFLENIKAPILSSNIIINTEETQKLKKYVIFNINGVKVGLLGYLALETKYLDSSNNIEYVDEIIALKEEVAKLQAQDVNIIIALGHSNIDKDIEIAKEVEGIDLVIGSHKNVFYWNGTSAETDVSNNNDAIVVTQQSGRRVPVVQSYAYNKYLGKLNIKFDTTGEIVDYDVNQILLDASIAEDIESRQIVETSNKNIAPISRQVLGRTAVKLDGESCRVEECNLGNLITDAIVYYNAVRFEGERWTDAPIAIIPGGDIAHSIAASNRPASVTRGDLLMALPVESNIVAVTMSGRGLTQLLEHSVSQYTVSNPTGQFLQFSGIRVTYDLDQPPGSRVVSALVRCWSCYVPEYYVIDERNYTILMPESIADGEYGYSMLVGMPKRSLDFDEVTSIAEYIQMRSPVYPEVAERIIILNNGAPDSAIAFSSTIVIFVLVTLQIFIV